LERAQTILLTGAAGFLGSHLAKKFLSHNFKVIGLDNLSSGNMKNLRDFKSDTNFKFIEHDITSPVLLKESVDFILNFACPASPVQYQINPIKTIETNFIGMSNLLKLAKELKIPILQASTSEIYGDPEITPQKETYWGNVNPIGIRSCYDEGKRAAETLCFDYARQFNLDVRVIRIFNTYGPNMAINDGRVVSNFIVQALKNIDITVFGNGDQTRSFCYVSDLVEGVYKIVLARNKLIYPINLGNPYEITVKSLAEKIIYLTQSSSKLIFSKLPSDDPQKRKPDITRALTSIEWNPQIDIEVGLLKTIKYFQSVLVK
jgi:UDP-glucuronate decarboxylase